MTQTITPAGHKKLSDELEERSTIVRQQIAARIQEAKEQGDLTENAEYQAAKTEQDENERRIAEIEIMLKEVTIVEHDHEQAGIVQLGSKILVRRSDVKGTATQAFELVSSLEASPLQGKISNESPLGKAFIGHRAGDSVTVETPGGSMMYSIVDVK